MEITPKVESPAAGSPALNLRERPLGFLRDFSWWKQAFRCSVRFAPRCWVPAALVTTANIGIVCAMGGLQQYLSSIDGVVGDTALFAMIGALLAVLIVCLVCLGLLLGGLTGWLMRLHAFARAFALAGVGADGVEFDEAKQHVQSQQKFLFIFWLVASAYLLLPAILVSLCIVSRVLLSPFVQGINIGGESLFSTAQQADLQRLGAGCAIVIPLLSIGILAYTFVGIVYGAIADRAPGRVATRALVDSVRHAGPVLLLTVVVSAINLFLASPFMAAVWLFPKAQLDLNVVFELCMQLWLGATSTFIWPLSVAPFCMITSNESRK